MNILITGAFGFLGSSITKYFSLNKENKVFALVKSTSSSFRFSGEELKRNNILFIDQLDLDTVFKNNIFDVIIHTATDYGRENSLDKLVENNVVFPLKLLNFAQKYDVSMFINTDSYFNKNASDYTYLQGYTLTKKHLEEYLETITSLTIINIKLEHIYGIYDAETKFVTNIFNKFVANEEIINTTAGFQKRDFIYVDDVVKLYFEIVSKYKKFDKTFYALEAGTGKSIEVRQFLSEMKRITQSKSNIHFGKLPMRTNEILDSYANLELIPGFIKWKPQIDIETGIKLMVDFKKKS